jgi:transposase-like protein
MGLGPPSCDKCKVWLTLHPPFVKNQRWRCPVCEKDSVDGYTHIRGGNDVLPYDVVPFLRFLNGKEND